MKKSSLIVTVVILVLVLFSLACSAVNTISYVASQVQFTATPPSPVAPLATATPIPSTTPTSLPTREPTLVPDSSAGEDARVEYYRAVFDVCMYSAKQANISMKKAVVGCHEFVRRAMKRDWFETPSHGWEWPLPISSPDSGA